MIKLKYEDCPHDWEQLDEHCYYCAMCETEVDDEPADFERYFPEPDDLNWAPVEEPDYATPYERRIFGENKDG